VAGKLLKRLGIGFAILAAVLLILGAGGYLYLRNSEWWVAVTLFHDDYRAENFRTMHELFPSAPVHAGGEVWHWSRDERPLPERYLFEGEERSVQEFLTRTETTGLLVAHDGTILHESYMQGYDQSSLITSFSMAKTFASVLVGLAIEDGYIDSVHDPITAYVPELRGGPYDGISIHHVLTMSSGVAFDEDYENFMSDVMWLPIRIFGFGEPIDQILNELEREREAGSYNNYVSSDSLVLSLLISRATGSPVTEYLEQRLWRPAGMEYNAYWNTDRHGNALTHAFLSASLQDFARLGRLYLNEGRRDGEQIVPEAWVAESLYRDWEAEPHLAPGENPDSFWELGFGYKWWIPEDPEGDYLAIGIWGQYIYVHPRYNIVITKTATDYYFDENDYENIAFFRAVAREMAAEMGAEME